MTRFLRERDLWVATGAALVAATALGVSLGAPTRPEAAVTPAVAALHEAVGQIKLRRAMTLGWSEVERGVDVHDGDALFVPPGSEATLQFLDGTEVSLDERSLVVIDQPRAGIRNVNLRQGSVSTRAGAEGLTLTTPVGEARLDPRSEAHVELTDVQIEVTVRKGGAQVASSQGASKTVTAGERASAAADGAKELPAWPVELTAPEPQAQFLFRGVPAPVNLSWKGLVPSTARIQIARDRLFAFVEQDLPAGTENAVTLERASPGVNWWRVVDAERRPISEARRFTCREDVAPTAMFPRAGEVILARPGTAVAFSWAPLPGLTRYRLEISPSQGFEPLTMSESVTGASARVSLQLAEATWYWRVRTEDEGELGLPSAPLRFRIIHKGIPDAPELLTPEIEVTP